MPTVCCSCTKAIVRLADDTVQCCKCGDLHHRVCVSISTGTSSAMLKQWECSNCEAGSTLDTVSAALQEMKKEFENVKKMQMDQSRSVDNVFKQLNTVGELSKQVKSNTTRISHLSSAVALLQQKCNRFENLERSRHLVVTGVPPKKNEDLKDTVFKIGKLLDCDLPSDAIDNCFRFKNNNSETKPILLIFNCALHRNSLLNLYRGKKKPVQAKDLGFDSASSIVIMEHMSADQKQLMDKVKDELVKTRLFQFAWFQGNNILIRKQQGDKILKVRELGDIARFKQT